MAALVPSALVGLTCPRLAFESDSDSIPCLNKPGGQAEDVKTSLSALSPLANRHVFIPFWKLMSLYFQASRAFQARVG